MIYEVKYTKLFRELLARIQQPHRKTILNRTKQLAHDPEKQGKPLYGPLRGHRSIHVGRYRLIFRIVRDEVQVFMLYAGLRKEGDKNDVYKLAQKLVKTFLH